MTTPRQHRLRYRTLLRAFEILGSRRALARQLRVPLADLDAWLKGDETPPTAVFLGAVDVVESQMDFARRLVQGNDPALDGKAHQAGHVANA